MAESDLAHYEQIFRDLKNRNAEKRERAERAVKALGPEDIHAVVMLYDKHRIRNQWMGGSWFFGTAWLSTMITMPIASFPMKLAVGLGIVAASFPVGNFASRNLRIREIARVLVAFNEPCCALSLLQASHLENGKQRLPILSTVTALLPKLTASDAQFVTEGQRKLMREIVTGENWAIKSVELRVAILQAFEQIGGFEELPSVQKIAEGKTKSSLDPRVREAAQACLPYLLERTPGRRSVQTLLRPADIPNAPVAHLLRAVSAVPDNASNELLRVVESPNVDLQAGKAIAPVAITTQTTMGQADNAPSILILQGRNQDNDA